MRTKYYLHIGGSEYELKDDDLMNWDEVKCSYKRENYGGVVRSFTSQFEFVNNARRLLLELYLAEGFNAKASVSVHTMTNSWLFEKRFECELDFSTVSWEGYVLRINCVDNSLTALIKANKGTKYEFAVGKDIIRDSVLSFDRIPMMESLTYEFTQGDFSDSSSAIRVTFRPDELPWIGNTNKEICVNGVIDWRDDQTNDLSSHILKTEKDIDIVLQFDSEWNYNHSSANGILLNVRIKRNGNPVAFSGNINDGNGGTFAILELRKTVGLGNYSNSGELPASSTLPGVSDASETIYYYALVSGYVWALEYKGRYVWENTGKKTPEEYFVSRTSGKIPLKLKAGDVVYIYHTFSYGNQPVTVNIINSKFIFSWMGIGGLANIDVFTPLTVGQALLDKMTERKLNVEMSISEHDPRLQGTFLMAAESARALIGAKFYSSFTEFCDWMSSVFGYVYLIEKCDNEDNGENGEIDEGEEETPSIDTVYECGGYSLTPYSFNEAHIGRSVSTDDIWYFPPYGRFLAKHPDTGNFYTLWPGSNNYNKSDGHARTDVYFRIIGFDPDAICRFETYIGSTLYPIVVGNSGNDSEPDGQVQYNLNFLHRSELFNGLSPVSHISESKNHKYSVETGSIYSTITAGYDKKDYESINGRDEFNFSNTYSTGCGVSDKTLSLISKYRADSYGIEFAVQKRGQDTTDTTSDKDVFFLLCERQSGKLVPDRSVAVGNAISDRLFNGAFSPMACIRANAGLIGLQSEDMTLKFASTTGNGDISIDEESLMSDIVLDTPLATCGILEFDTDTAFGESSVNRLIEVSDGEYIYRGFLKEVDTMYARAETTKCKIIVKEIIPC